METKKPDATTLTPKKRSPPAKQRQLAIERAMQTLLSQGFTIHPPDLEADAAKKAAAADQLGVVKHAMVHHYGPKPKTAKPKAFTVELSFPHTINGIVYGPGIVTVASASLMENLANKDHISKEQENRTFETISRCHLIVNKVDAYGRQAAFAQPVDPNIFNSPSGLMQGQIYREFSSSDVPRY